MGLGLGLAVRVGVVVGVGSEHLGWGWAWGWRLVLRVDGIEGGAASLSGRAPSWVSKAPKVGAPFRLSASRLTRPFGRNLHDTQAPSNISAVIFGCCGTQVCAPHFLC